MAGARPDSHEVQHALSVEVGFVDAKLLDHHVWKLGVDALRGTSQPVLDLAADGRELTLIWPVLVGEQSTRTWTPALDDK